MRITDVMWTVIFASGRKGDRGRKKYHIEIGGEMCGRKPVKETFSRIYNIIEFLYHY